MIGHTLSFHCEPCVDPNEARALRPYAPSFRVHEWEETRPKGEVWFAAMCPKCNRTRASYRTVPLLSKYEQEAQF